MLRSLVQISKRRELEKVVLGYEPAEDGDMKILEVTQGQVKLRVNGKEIITLYDPDDLEGTYMLAALERLLVDHDVRSFEGFMEDLTTTAIERDMEGAEGWDKNNLKK